MVSLTFGPHQPHYHLETKLHAVGSACQSHNETINTDVCSAHLLKQMTMNYAISRKDMSNVAFHCGAELGQLVSMRSWGTA